MVRTVFGTYSYPAYVLCIMQFCKENLFHKRFKSPSEVSFAPILYLSNNHELICLTKAAAVGP